MILLELFGIFFFIGLVSIGGGLSTIPLLTEMLIERSWMTNVEIIDMIAVSEMTPGPIGINMATFAGNNVAGIPGGVMATLGLVAPSVIIIIVVAHFYNRYKNNIYVNGMMDVIRPVVTGLIAAVCADLAVFSLLDIPAFKESGVFLSLFSPMPILIAVIVFMANYKFKVHPVILIVSSAVLGIILL